MTGIIKKYGCPRNLYYKDTIASDMKTYLVDKTENTVTVAFKDANLTLITPLMKALYDDEDVELVRYIDKHPELEDRQLFVQVKKGDPVDALKKASDAVSDYFSGIKQ
ncbi:MAG: hypothetical protein IJX35_00565 [Candidatus Methanomethylophilaceae archaeon]|nr:hypothetical protein [Candidatus Methanomethylophilaceae archaeon]